VGAVIALGVAIGLGVWLGTRDEGNSSQPSANSAVGATGKTIVPISAGGLQTLVDALKRPIYWAGQEPAKTYELTRTADGSVYIRYLPKGVKLGSSRPLLTIGTYPVQDAFAVTQNRADKRGSIRIPSKGAVAFYNTKAPTSVYLAFPGSDFQVEVYDPSPAQARQLVRSGKIVAVTAKTGAGTPALVSEDQLKASARKLSHPLYWAGPMANASYELREDQGDRTYIRYLPRGVPAGLQSTALTIGSYGIPGAFAVTQRSSRQPGAVQVPVTGGGIAFYNKSAPTSVYVAFPKENVQIEVFDPSPARARQLVTSGKIVPIR
jgi:hypothetical protein